MNIPNLFIIGAPKCGTTSLYFYLSQHPDIFLSELKEPHFFNVENKIHYRERTKEEYLNLFHEAKHQKYIGEGSTQYLISKVTAGRIKALSPNAKIIIALRRPVDLLQSVYDQLFYAGHETAENFAQAIKEEKNRSSDKLSKEETQILENRCYSQIPLFSEHIENYLLTFGKGNIHFVLFDDMKKIALDTVNSVCTFLELPALNQLDEKILNSRVKPKNIWFKRFLVAPPESLKNIIKGIIPSQNLRRKLFFKLNSVNTSKQGQRVPISYDLEQELIQRFEEEVNMLSVLINRDLSHWNKCKTEKLSLSNSNR